MGKNIINLPDGQDFGASADHFPKGFGFSGSSQGYDSASVAPPFAGANPKNMKGPNNSRETSPKFAKGGTNNMHPDGHQIVRVEADGNGGAVHHHAHGGFTVHHMDGQITHHAAGGAVAGGSADTFAGGGAMMRKGGKMHGHKPKMPMAKKAAPVRMAGIDTPENKPPRNPTQSTSPRNAMPGGQMAYGVEPSDEPDVAGADQGIPQMSRGGRHGI